MTLSEVLTVNEEALFLATEQAHTMASIRNTLCCLCQSYIQLHMSSIMPTNCFTTGT